MLRTQRPINERPAKTALQFALIHSLSSNRTIRWGLLFAGCSSVVLPAAPPLVDSPQHLIIHRKAGEYSAFPALYRLNDGSLYVRLTDGVTNSHLEPRQKTLSFRSDNGGLSWEPTERAAWNPAYASSPERRVNAHAYGWRFVAPSERANLEAQGIEVRASPDGRITYTYGCFCENQRRRRSDLEGARNSGPGEGIDHGLFRCGDAGPDRLANTGPGGVRSAGGQCPIL